MMDKNTIGKGAAYLYVEAVTMLFSGYIYWLILSKIASPSVIGISSTAISFITIFIVGSSIGVAGGIQRFLGKGLAERKIEEIKIFIKSSLFILGIGILGSSIILLILKDWIYNSFKIDFSLSILLILIMGTSSISSLFRAIIIPSLKTKVITTSSILSTVIKISLTVTLVMMGMGVSGILVGFMLYPIVSSITLSVAIKKYFYNGLNRNKKNLKHNYFHYIKNIMSASVAFWIPGLITTIGSQLGTVFVFISNGSSHAGIYFISFSIVTGITLIMSVLSTIAYPTISSMDDGRKRAVWRLIKLSLLITLPLSNSIIFYSTEIMQLFGSNYTSGSTNLKILLLSILPTSLTLGLGVLVYAYAKNRLVLIIGLFTSIPRVLLYFIFVPIFGGDGAALTFDMGAVIGCIVSIIIANRIGFKIFWKQILLIMIIPAFIAISFKYLNLNLIFVLPITIIISYILLLRLHIIDKEDILDITRILPEKIATPIVVGIMKIFDRLNKP
jgi:O-antigen/teichoic acid export membrane protein